MLDLSSINPLLIAALTSSVAALLLGFFINFFKRGRLVLQYSVRSTCLAQVDSVPSQGPLLLMKFGNLDIQRLDYHEVSLYNAGNQPLVNVPVRLESSSGGYIAATHAQPPRGAQFSLQPIGLNAIKITTDLLNPGESVTVSLKVANASDIRLDVTARAERLKVQKIRCRERGVTRSIHRTND